MNFKLYLNSISRKPFSRKFIVITLIVTILMVTKIIKDTLKTENFKKITTEINLHMEKVFQEFDKDDQNEIFYSLESKNLTPIKMTNFTAVFQLKNKNKKFCIKRVIFREEAPTQEGEISLFLRHPNIPKTFYSFNTTFKDLKLIWIVSEFLTENVSHKTVKGNENVIREIMRDSLQALKYLHSRNIAHLDIKMANIMGIKKDGANKKDGKIIYKLIDMGYSRVLKKDLGVNETYIPKKSFGTFPYKPPEVVKQSIHGIKSDIYSLGAVAWFLSLKKTPFYKKGFKDMTKFKKFISGHIPFWFDTETSKELKEFILQCMNFNREMRPSAEELLEDAFIRG